jgi:hypothetical protein
MSGGEAGFGIFMQFALALMLPLLGIAFGMLCWLLQLCKSIKDRLDNWEPPHRPERPGKPTT